METRCNGKNFFGNLENSLPDTLWLEFGNWFEEVLGLTFWKAGRGFKTFLCEGCAAKTRLIKELSDQKLATLPVNWVSYLQLLLDSVIYLLSSFFLFFYSRTRVLSFPPPSFFYSILPVKHNRKFKRVAIG